MEQSVEIARSVASALDHANRNGVIQRDIIPESILLHEGQALVADFGIALAISAAAGSRLTETGLSIGTPHYMSPEQAPADRNSMRAATCIRWLCCFTKCSWGNLVRRGFGPGGRCKNID